MLRSPSKQATKKPSHALEEAAKQAAHSRQETTYRTAQTAYHSHFDHPRSATSE